MTPIVGVSRNPQSASPFSPHPMSTVRLQKFLADAGVASRRASEKLIVRGVVTVNGRVVTELGS